MITPTNNTNNQQYARHLFNITLEIHVERINEERQQQKLQTQQLPAHDRVKQKTERQQ